MLAVHNTHPGMLLHFAEKDFECAWNALAATPVQWASRGNYMFARQAMVYLEVACRICRSDVTGAALRDLSDSLAKREPRYFITLPGPCCVSTAEFELPSRGPQPQAELLWALFDLIRNGQGHQYQQINVSLADGAEFFVSLTGAEPGLNLGTSLASGRPPGHLECRPQPDGGINLRVRTDVLFLDFRDSVSDARIAERGLTLTYLRRPRRNTGDYSYSSAELVKALGCVPG